MEEATVRGRWVEEEEVDVDEVEQRDAAAAAVVDDDVDGCGAFGVQVDFFAPARGATRSSIAFDMGAHRRRPCRSIGGASFALFTSPNCFFVFEKK